MPSENIQAYLLFFRVEVIIIYIIRLVEKQKYEQRVSSIKNT